MALNERNENRCNNPGDVGLLRYALDRLGDTYELIVLADGAEALEFVRTYRAGILEPQPCVIILDLHLPKHDGLEVLRQIVQSPPLRHIQVLMTAGSAQPSDAAQIIALGAIYREKPNSLQQYMEFASEVIALCKKSLLTAA